MQIDSNYLLPDIEQHFRVSAGPGAGKTHWLVQHIKNVLHNSKRLGKTRKIACITYTNIAVETILERLGTTSEHVEVSTIHSFLYKHIVKPYANFITDNFGLNVEKMDGHDDTILSNYSFLRDWKIRTGQLRITEDNKVINAFQNLKWIFDTSNELVVKTDYPHRANGYAIKNTSYLEYKKMCWEKGIIHHDDVLFFSHEIIRRYPFTLNVLRAKFPYFFVDEFQDSNPIQVSILKEVGSEETIVGIIGDIAQSIYGFQGAQASQFTSFALPGIEDYQMLDNRRSTNRIIDVLNITRTDLVQNRHRNEEGNIPKIFVGDMLGAHVEACSHCQREVVYTLSRDNITSNAMKRSANGIILNNQLFNELYDSDSNSIRRKTISVCIKAIELAREKKFKDAIKELYKMYGGITDKEEKKKKAMNDLCLLLSNYNTYNSGTLYDFHSFLKTNINSSIANLAKGKAKTFYETHSYQQLAICVKIPEDMSFHKTIHKAKGDEFDNVLIVLKEESNLEFLLAPDLINNEEQRINYVAASRAREKLFISIPNLSDANRAALSNCFEIEEV
ncbi:ATP-dependent helicase [Marinifilum breve]|uniref:DNA 3'-5' helicase n=1 Tax=Marinifilum breve TaxID=2184082 RepID=A0A2V3ZUM8_9BACT|nr:ATP-dependent helicase [Marinifilum breve]PXX98780.1 ATP-dependent helicase [Marinifilum breve]